jgi:predicted phosphodiesterase
MATPKQPGCIDAISHRIECNDDIKICPLSDLHIGDKNCNYDLISNIVSDIKNDDLKYTFLLGDLMNTAIANSKSDSYSEQLTPGEQIDKCYAILNPIREKILAIIPGNHEERISKSCGLDTTKILADRLGISDLFSASSALVILHIGQRKGHRKNEKPIPYSFYLNHGHGGGRRVGGKANGLSDFASIIDADVLIQGHTHMPMCFRQQHYRISIQNDVATLHEQIMINLPSSLSYGGYGMRGGYQPASNKYPSIILGHDSHKIDVIM